MKTDKKKKPENNCQPIDVNILSPLISGLKVARIEEIEIDGNSNGISLALDNKKGDRIYLLIEPTVKAIGRIDLTASIHTPT